MMTSPESSYGPDKYAAWWAGAPTPTELAELRPSRARAIALALAVRTVTATLPAGGVGNQGFEQALNRIEQVTYRYEAILLAEPEVDVSTFADRFSKARTGRTIVLPPEPLTDEQVAPDPGWPGK
jgi:hypothetical protein